MVNPFLLPIFISQRKKENAEKKQESDSVGSVSPTGQPEVIRWPPLDGRISPGKGTNTYYLLKFMRS